MKRVKVIVGCQWGDEGKGAEIDRCAEEADLVCRCAGGNNAGHTIVHQGEEMVLHLIPSSITKGKKVGIGAGVSVDPLSLINEILYVRSFGIEPVGRLVVDQRAIMNMIWHRAMDMAKEIIKSRGGRAIGTTAKGIGPSYADQASRDGLRVGDLTDPEGLIKLIRQQMREKEEMFRGMGLSVAEWKNIFESLAAKEIQANSRLLKSGTIKESELDYRRFAADGEVTDFAHDEIINAYLKAAELISQWNLIGDVSDLVHQAVTRGKNVLVEGAQGCHLDNYYGTFPYVTSSCTLAGGACGGLGIGPTLIGEVRGIAKAYTTRVGNGPFPTRMDKETAERIRGNGQAIGDEFGATTRRPRDCGWFDAVLVRSACRWNGVTCLTLTKLDKLSGLEKIQVGLDWISPDGKHHLFVPARGRFDGKSEFLVNYAFMPGWQEDITSVKQWDDLPENARKYVEALEKTINHCATEKTRIDRVGVGPGPSQVVTR
ncbi:adenylosuccinate synthetase [Candidatus Falkowbacteria bacterium]|nr:adenylosuccinate synthetase [Candidatus Falkowbacteria bacterium]